VGVTDIPALSRVCLVAPKRRAMQSHLNAHADLRRSQRQTLSLDFMRPHFGICNWGSHR
jgi:hypothetical protein